MDRKELEAKVCELVAISYKKARSHFLQEGSFRSYGRDKLQD